MKQTQLAIVAISFLAIGLIATAEAASFSNGWSSTDRERVTFEGVYKTPIYLMSNSQINIIQGQASEQFVKVFFDGELIETIDVGREPAKRSHEAWIGFNEFVEIPFDAYFKILENGMLIDLSDATRIGQNADGTEFYLDADGDRIGKQ